MTDEEAAETLPKIMWIPADDVARAGVEGLAAGRTVVIPGAANRVGAGLAHLAPKSILVPLMAKRHPGTDRPSQGGRRGVTAANVSDAARPRASARGTPGLRRPCGHPWAALGRPAGLPLTSRRSPRCATLTRTHGHGGSCHNWSRT